MIFMRKNICKACYHCRQDKNSSNLPPHTLCELDNVIRFEMYKCVNHNKDVLKDRICFNCSHFLGGNDWGLSCSADYYKITSALDEACDKFERKEKE